LAGIATASEIWAQKGLTVEAHAFEVDDCAHISKTAWDIFCKQVVITNRMITGPPCVEGGQVFWKWSMLVVRNRMLYTERTCWYIAYWLTQDYRGPMWCSYYHRFYIAEKMRRYVKQCRAVSIFCEECESSARNVQGVY
jgi:hypothetical protein